MGTVRRRAARTSATLVRSKEHMRKRDAVFTVPLCSMSSAAWHRDLATEPDKRRLQLKEAADKGVCAGEWSTLNRAEGDALGLATRRAGPGAYHGVGDRISHAASTEFSHRGVERCLRLPEVKRRHAAAVTSTHKPDTGAGAG